MTLGLRVVDVNPNHVQGGARVGAVVIHAQDRAVEVIRQLDAPRGLEPGPVSGRGAIHRQGDAAELGGQGDGEIGLAVVDLRHANVHVVQRLAVIAEGAADAERERWAIQAAGKAGIDVRGGLRQRVGVIARQAAVAATHAVRPVGHSQEVVEVVVEAFAVALTKAACVRKLRAMKGSPQIARAAWAVAKLALYPVAKITLAALAR